MDVTLECRDLKFSYNARPVWSGISFDLPPGRFLAVLGRNGTGKTSLLHCLNRILTPDAGSVCINGKDIKTFSQARLARTVSLVPQELTDIFPFKVLDLVAMGRAPFLSLTQKPGPLDYDLAMETLAVLNAGGLARRHFNRMSGGEKKLVLLARALVQSGDIMLLDEPTNHLDFNNQYGLLSTVEGLCRSRGLSVVASFHDPNMASVFAHDALLLKQGKCLAQGPVSQVMTRTNLSRLYDTPIRDLPIPDRKSGRPPFFIPQHILKAYNHDN